MHIRKDLAVWLLIARINSATISALQSRLIAPGESPVVYYVIACHYNHVISANAVAGLLAQIHSTEPAACSTTCGISITFGAGFLTSCIYTTNGKTFIARSQMDFHDSTSTLSKLATSHVAFKLAPTLVVAWLCHFLLRTAT
jgi:hypothetical protein